jgi:hypothetical protein
VTQAAAPAQAEPAVDPVDEDAERVLAAMPAHWRAMLEKAEVYNRRERMGWCMTCHIDVRDEVAGGAHEKNDVSCGECHGASERHARDENNDIKPDQVFARRDVDEACGDCHACSRPAAIATASSDLVCTDCHAAHKFARESAPPQESAPASRLRAMR